MNMRWVAIALAILVAGAQAVEIGLLLEGGGDVRFDDVRLEVLGAAPPKQ